MPLSVAYFKIARTVSSFPQPEYTTIAFKGILSTAYFTAALVKFLSDALRT
jgi:hypothetical protein